MGGGGRIAVPAGVFATISIFVAAGIGNGVDPAFLPLSHIDNRTGHYVLYLSNCGAVCHFVLVLRKESPPIGPFKRVWPLWSLKDKTSAALRLSASGEVQVVQGESVLYTLPP